MVTIKGPRSALTDFIQEEGIKIQKRKTKIIHSTISIPRKKKKVARRSKPMEICNLDNSSTALEDIVLKKIDSEYWKYVMNDEQLERYASYLGRTRLMDDEKFKYFVSSCKYSLVIYDCSEIISYSILPSNLQKLCLYYCGQLGKLDLTEFTDLKELRVTGAYLLENFYLPSTLNILDVTHCSRLNDDFILQINDKFDELEELKLSYCYGISNNILLKCVVKRLFLCETRITDFFLRNLNKSKNINSVKNNRVKRCDIKEIYDKIQITGIEYLSLKRCPNISIKELEFDSIKYLDVEGIACLKKLNLPSNVEFLNVSYCYNLNEISNIYKNNDFLIKHLNLGKIGNIKKIEKIFKWKNIKDLDLSWCEQVDDKFIEILIKELPLLERVYVFGCFNLTEKIGRMAWEIKNSIKIIGNPAETTYLLNRVFDD
ncbi:DNA repair protein rhp7 [Astathelohania contejeani]|uniref:DNA repair protein rhp7 n=1 Tax=Astathelohania contejeani TaxID=164912 RepID=A0ABQ7HWJ4_9MICR|nr:DNA repair protein rhp7 [Thelohania contejeani]